ncbi:MAG: protocatechuate 3,4-dioxygenase subunit alpha [Acidocella sp. 20-57-95]|nr:MAG: protocatechuate 3,4-dioxygenase subunit alpha [Acidocella sp. 20-57-95]OYV62180.1 MAG: protocatechuate 3,4-dioxygenase subunit alpha [Acidocella sp. 21-58-7]HQT63628.1 protocatechuate 3,4-dioxygenase subunit alpha [Acidocella sp.]HQU04001.1 protocatechuate 3,4-dioxygenase subunit alpha [Acidocella sp.]
MQTTINPTTTSQTIGPYWHLIEDKSWSDLTRFGASGEVITVEGNIRDGAGALANDACVEIWQTSPATSDAFPGFGRAATDAAGKFSFKTIKPGPVAGPGNTLQAPHLAVTILARGLMFHLATRLYFENEPANENDPILSLIADKARRNTLLARETKPGVWHLDIHLQGEAETVFFDI